MVAIGYCSENEKTNQLKNFCLKKLENQKKIELIQEMQLFNEKI